MNPSEPSLLSVYVWLKIWSKTRFAFFFILVKGLNLVFVCVKTKGQSSVNVRTDRADLSPIRLFVSNSGYSILVKFHLTGFRSRSLSFAKQKRKRSFDGFFCSTKIVCVCVFF